ncbi:MAG: lipoyl synthase [Polyangiaceae bacterium]
MKPPWLRVRAPGGDRYHELKKTFRDLKLFTVCEEARCPNVGECWREGTATVMLLGDVCTRGCRFCAVTTGRPGALDMDEPEHVATAIGTMALQYVVLTMVDRDDIPDGGARQVARTVSRLKELRDDLLVETLVGDFQGEEEPIDIIVDSKPDVFAHNIEVVRRITRKIRDVRCGYDRTLAVLKHAKDRAPDRVTKSSIMVGIGETDDEVMETLHDLRGAGVDIVTIGQYLRPTPKHAEVDRFVPPESFAEFEKHALGMGFLYAASGPLVRSSYKAAEVFVRSILRPEGGYEGVLEERLERARAAAEKAAEAQTVSELAARTATTLLREEAQYGDGPLITLGRKPR